MYRSFAFLGHFADHKWCRTYRMNCVLCSPDRGFVRKSAMFSLVLTYDNNHSLCTLPLVQIGELFRYMIYPVLDCLVTTSSAWFGSWIKTMQRIIFVEGQHWYLVEPSCGPVLFLWPQVMFHRILLIGSRVSTLLSVLLTQPSIQFGKWDWKCVVMKVNSSLAILLLMERMLSKPAAMMTDQELQVLMLLISIGREKGRVLSCRLCSVNCQCFDSRMKFYRRIKYEEDTYLSKKLKIHGWYTESNCNKSYTANSTC